MIRNIIISIFLGWVSILQAQTRIDSLNTTSYLEDQIYLALTYNDLSNRPKSVSQNGFSGGVSIGFIKDISAGAVTFAAFTFIFVLVITYLPYITNYI